MDELAERPERIERMLAELLEREMVQEYYPTDELAGLVGKPEFTVREWARPGRIHAARRQSGRGAYAERVVGHPELLRHRQRGLLPRLVRG